MNESVLIVDFGSQFTQLIARRVREIGVFCEIIPYNLVDESLGRFSPQAIILSGGPASVLSRGRPEIPKKLLIMGVPVLGICYGLQAMCSQLGGKVTHTDHREFGRASIQVKEKSLLFEDIWEVDETDEVWMSHGDRVDTLPKGFRVLAESDAAPFAVIGDDERRFYGVQFHPEVVHTPKGKDFLRNFLKKVAYLRGEWTMTNFREKAIADIKNLVGQGKVICGLSGGVDSSVVALLLHHAIGKQLTCVFVDNGLLRSGEARQVTTFFRDEHKIPLVQRDASEVFLKALEGIKDPELKRKIIGKKFIEIFETESKKIGGAEFLAQGTLYPDVIESVSFHGGPSATIKSHHNVGGLPKRMKLKLVEPVRNLFKDEVRALGRELGMSGDLIDRHPFPGPGLAIRVLGSVDREKLEILRKADLIFLEEIQRAGLYNDIWQAFAVLLPVRTVGVMGDERSYEFVCALRAVTSVDGMTADFYPFDPCFLGKVSNRITNEVRGINRVVYDYTSKPPGTIEWE